MESFDLYPLRESVPQNAVPRLASALPGKVIEMPINGHQITPTESEFL